MPDVVNVRFRNRGKVYYFDPAGFAPEAGSAVVVETANGLELGDCVEGVHAVEDSRVVSPLRPVVRLATAEDVRLAENNRAREKAAFAICEEKIRNHGLDMKLVDVEYSFEGGKIRFFFTSDGRVDFRELVKDLASVFHTRIDLRQIGVRDGAKMLGGLGICGRPFCCSTFLEEFQPVSIRMAKTQSLSLNPTKISGTCGRLMCCLKYEQEAYEYLVKNLPRADAPVDTPKGKGVVTDVNLLRRTVKVRLLEGADTTLQTYSVDRLGYTIGGEYIEPKPEEPAPPPEELPNPGGYMTGTALRSSDYQSELRAGDAPRRNEKRGDRRGERNEGGREPRDSKEPREQRPRSNRPKNPNRQGEQNKPRQGEQKPRQGEQNKGGESKPRPPKPRGPRPGGGQGGAGPQPGGQAAPGAVAGAAPGATPHVPAAEGERTEKKSGGHYRRYRRPGKKPGDGAGNKE